MSIDALKEAVKSLAQTLHVATIFPAGLFVLVNAYFIIPTFYPGVDYTTAQAVTVLISLTLMLSYMLYAFNFPLIRVFEGYKFDVLGSDIVEKLKGIQRGRFEKYEKQGEQSILDRNFPSKPYILPTKIGNTIKAFEEYPSNRYGMDAIALWPRLVPVLQDEDFLVYVTQEKAVFDFLLNTWIVVALLGAELAYRALFIWNLSSLIIIVVAMGFALFVLYEGMNIAARQWGTVVRVAFDLHRHHLAQRLGLIPAASFRGEWNRWTTISKFFLHREPSPSYRSFKEFIPQSQIILPKKP
jgi:hypothetical protein